MKIRYTKHALKKFIDLKQLGVDVTKRVVKSAVVKPSHLDDTSDAPNLVVSGELDKNHALRVVYRKEGGIIIIITFYPAKKGRYYL